MKKTYEVEYINERGNYAIQVFGSKAAAMKFTKNHKWFMVCTSDGDIIADNSIVIEMQQQLDEVLSIR